LEITGFSARIMVTRSRGRHVLPNQDLRPPLLPPDRREPLGGRTTPAAGPRHPRAARTTPALRSTRCPPGLGRPPGPVRPPALRPPQRAAPPHHSPRTDNGSLTCFRQRIAQSPAG